MIGLSSFYNTFSSRNITIYEQRSPMTYFLLGVLSPIILNLIHLLVGIYITKSRGNMYGVGFSAIGFVSKTLGMVFLTWFGVSFVKLDFRIFVPLLVFFWFITHIVEAFIINDYMNKNISKK
tara:strand:+ start:98 stop:463 length:366 start_codon:yes stop_codon:yes gene_type:complete